MCHILLAVNIFGIIIYLNFLYEKFYVMNIYFFDIQYYLREQNIVFSHFNFLKLFLLYLRTRKWRLQRFFFRCIKFILIIFLFLTFFLIISPSITNIKRRLLLHQILHINFYNKYESSIYNIMSVCVCKHQNLYSNFK